MASQPAETGKRQNDFTSRPKCVDHPDASAVQLKVNHEQAIHYDQPGRVAFRVERVLCNNNSSSILNLFLISPWSVLPRQTLHLDLEVGERSILEAVNQSPWSWLLRKVEGG